MITRCSLRLHGNCRSGILGTISRWWWLWRCGILTCCIWLSTAFLFSLNHSQVMSSSFFIKHLKWGVLPHNSYGHILKTSSGSDNEKSSVEKPKGMTLPDKHWHSFYNNVKTDLKEHSTMTQA